MRKVFYISKHPKRCEILQLLHSLHCNLNHFNQDLEKMNYCRIRCIVSRIILLTHPIEALCLMIIINYILLFLESSMKLVITFILQSTKMKNKTCIWKISITFKLQGRFPPTSRFSRQCSHTLGEPHEYGNLHILKRFLFFFPLWEHRNKKKKEDLPLHNALGFFSWGRSLKSTHRNKKRVVQINKKPWPFSN